MFPIDLGALREGPIDMTQTVPVDDPVFDSLEFRLAQPVRLSGRLSETGPDSYFWHGEMRTTVLAACRRCLSPVEVSVVQPIEVLFTEDPEPDDPAAYSIPRRASELDPGEAVREELILAVPEYVLCRDDCKGLCPGCGTDLNKQSCECKPEVDSRWAALEALKAARPEDERA